MKKTVTISCEEDVCDVCEKARAYMKCAICKVDVCGGCRTFVSIGPTDTHGCQVCVNCFSAANFGAMKKKIDRIRVKTYRAIELASRQETAEMNAVWEDMKSKVMKKRKLAAK